MGHIFGGVAKSISRGATHQVVEVVSVNGSDVVEAELLKERPPGGHPSHVLVEPLIEVLETTTHHMHTCTKRLKKLGEPLAMAG